MLYEQYVPKEGRRWPVWLRWLEPHRAEDRKKFLFRCSCGRLLWQDAPQEILRQHLGHRMSPATSGSMWEFFKMKVGWLNKLTVRERLQQKGWL